MASKSGRPPRAVVFGLAGTDLNDAEAALFQHSNPAGFILFSRNCQDAKQVSQLIGRLRACVETSDPLILVDQEGGRVQRLGPPAWRLIPPASRFAAIADHDETRALQGAWLNARITGRELAELGFTVNCAPVLDVPNKDSHEIIGDRAYGQTADRVAMLGRAVAAGLLAGGVLPVIKHVPGHGRARVDSHVALPVVAADLAAMRAADFAPFAALADQACAMTAHVVYEAIDPEQPATLSPKVIADVIRGEIGFDGLLFSDDICMGALSGSIAERTTAALAAGCDIVLHCNGVLDEMAAVAEACPEISDAAATRLARARSLRASSCESFEMPAALKRLVELLAQ